MSNKVAVADRDVYDGDLKDGKQHGKGKMNYADGDVYNGDWKDGRRHGKGKMNYADGDVYDGDWRDDKSHGKGKYTEADGDVYDGDWKDENMHGKGKYTDADGNVYDGDWRDGKKHGKGKMKYADGDVYDGDWRDDKSHGKGKLTYASGSVYDGDWRDDKSHGKGKYTDADGDVYDGDWKDDNMHGKGKMNYANGDVYDGDWKDDNMHGKGKYTDANGDVYDGDWKDGRRHGKGKYEREDDPSFNKKRTRKEIEEEPSDTKEGNKKKIASTNPNTTRDCFLGFPSSNTNVVSGEVKLRECINKNERTMIEDDDLPPQEGGRALIDLATEVSSAENNLNDTKIIELLTFGGDAQTLTVGSPYVEVSKGPYSYRLIVPEKHKSTTNVFVTRALHRWEYAEHETDKFTCKCQPIADELLKQAYAYRDKISAAANTKDTLPAAAVQGAPATDITGHTVQQLERSKETMSVRERAVLGSNTQSD